MKLQNNLNFKLNYGTEEILGPIDSLHRKPAYRS